MTIYSCFTGKTYDDIEREFEGKGYGDFKAAVGEAAAEGLAPIQQKYREIIADKAQLEQILARGAEKAKDTAYTVLNRVYAQIGFYEVHEVKKWIN
jgi:tryptophanyl-tRNA synthetase